MTGTRIYQGWRYTLDEKRPAKQRWVATKGTDELAGPTEASVKKLIDARHEHASRNHKLALAV